MLVLFATTNQRSLILFILLLNLVIQPMIMVFGKSQKKIMVSKVNGWVTMEKLDYIKSIRKKSLGIVLVVILPIILSNLLR